ncbi:unnamed protein product [Arabidopsis halleri]
MDPGYLKRNKCLEFVKKAYEMVNDPSTDSIISWGPNGDTFIVWNPSKCCTDLLPQYLGIRNFKKFEYYGFKMVESRQLEFACDDFVKDQPELLEKIGQRYKEMLYQNHGKRVETLVNRLKSCKTEKEGVLVSIEYFKKGEMKMRAKMDQFLAKEVERFMKTVAYERKIRGGEDLPKHVEDRLQLVCDSLDNLTNAAAADL